MRKMLVIIAILSALAVVWKIAEQVDPVGSERFGFGATMFLIGASILGLPIGAICWLGGAAMERGKLATEMIQRTPRREIPQMSLVEEAALAFYLRNGYKQEPQGWQGYPQIPVRVNQRPAEHTVTVIGGD